MPLALIIVGAFTAGCVVSWHLTNAAWYRMLERYFQYHHPVSWQSWMKSFIVTLTTYRHDPPRGNN